MKSGSLALSLLFSLSLLSLSPLVALTLVLGPAAPLHAQSSEARARASFERGMRELDAGRYRDATVAFERSFSLAPRLPTAFNWALALRGLGHALDAEALYQRLLDGELGELRATDRSAVEGLMREVRASIGTLELTLEGPDPLEVRLDGVVIAEAPGESSHRVDPGEHLLIASAQDHETIERRFRASGDTSTIALALVPARDARPGSLVLESSDDHAQFRVLAPDEQTLVGEGGSPWSGSLTPGRYVIVTSGEHGEQRTEIDVPAGRTVALSLDPPGRPLVEEPWLWIGVGLGVAAIVGVAVGISYSERAVPPFENQAFPTIYALSL